MTSKMFKETLETQEAIIRQWKENIELRKEISNSWREKDPYSFLTIARGSSDHAAQYFNYLASLKLKKLTTSLMPSLISLHETELDCSKSISVAISQSGRSPDLIAPIKKIAEQGSTTIALVNKEGSPLADVAKQVYPLKAGEEVSVAATKSFISSLYASASLIAETAGDQTLIKSLEDLRFNEQGKNPWPKMIDILLNKKRAMIVGRGIGFSIALEAALKLKETCHIQAEAFSAAEIKHGPQAVIEEGYPLIIFALRGPMQKQMLELGQEMKERGAEVFTITDHGELSYKPASHNELDPLTAIHDFYLMVEELTRKRGLDPDNPRSLAKETLTL